MWIVDTSLDLGTPCNEPIITSVPITAILGGVVFVSVYVSSYRIQRRSNRRKTNKKSRKESKKMKQTTPFQLLTETRRII